MVAASLAFSLRVVIRSKMTKKVAELLPAFSTSTVKFTSDTLADALIPFIPVALSVEVVANLPTEAVSA